MRVGEIVGLITTVFLSLVIVSTAVGRVSVETNQFKQAEIGLTAGTPGHCLAAHRVGKMGLAVTNSGTLGKGFFPGADVDFFTGEAINYSCEYPRGSNTDYLFAASLWIGAVVGRDTLVSVGADGWSPGAEMFPDYGMFGYMIKRTAGHPEAVSDEDYIAVYMDTITQGVSPDPHSGRPHIPLNVEITQSSYAWAYPWTEDFILIDYEIKNIGNEALVDVYVGIYVDADIYHPATDPMGFQDDISGFLSSWLTAYGSCEFIDTINVAWSADNDGNLYATHISVPHVTGTRILRTPTDQLGFSYNWWWSNSNSAFDFGPRRRATPEDPWRDFGTGGIGTPEGDHNKHYILRHPEFDYDQAFTAIIPPNDP
ncbi:MAG: hypothetical protein KAW46_08745, partial [candidate division Zixibacteria bacterium]|nr:hypothetical protein [candidate division Zixibacteria bacterium]